MNSREFIILILTLFSIPLSGQVKTEWLDTTTHAGKAHLLFFTNRPMYYTPEGLVEFEDKWNRRTDTLTFGTYHLDEDTFSIKYRAVILPEKVVQVPREQNFLYKVYEDLHVKKGIRHFEIIIPGFAKTFGSQRYDFMKSIKTNYADTLQHSIAFITYAWACEWRAYKYLDAKKSAIDGAFDFYILHYLLEQFLHDSVFFKDKSRDFTVGLLCTSMGNELLKQFLLEAEKRNIPLQKNYEYILMIGSDASWDSFEPGKGFHNIDRITDNVVVIMNRKDQALGISQIMNMKKRLGRHGPRKPGKLPPYVSVYDMSGKMTINEIKRLYHDYFLLNPFLIDLIIDTYESSLQEVQE